MANSYLLETLRGTAAANRLQIATLIESLLRSVELLNCRQSNTRRFGWVFVTCRTLAYPVLARSLRARKDNFGLPWLRWRCWIKKHPRRPNAGAWQARVARPHSKVGLLLASQVPSAWQLLSDPSYCMRWLDCMPWCKSGHPGIGA